MYLRVHFTQLLALMYESGLKICLCLSVYIVPLVVGLHHQVLENPLLIFLRSHHTGCICKTVTKVMDPILIFVFLSTNCDIWQI